MNISVIYLAQRFIYRLGKFIYNWYIATFFVISEYFTNIFESLDRSWALKITLRNFFKPLYQDKTVVGRALGVFFRFWRLFFGVIIYGAVFVLGVVIYLAWAALPIYIIYLGIK